MNKLLDILLCGGVVIGELFAAIVGMLLIQLIFYRVFNINLYKSIINELNKLDQYLDKVF